MRNVFIYSNTMRTLSIRLEEQKNEYDETFRESAVFPMKSGGQARSPFSIVLTLLESNGAHS